MTDESNGEGIAQNKSFRKQMLDQHRPAFDIWLRLAQLLEEAVVGDRDLQSAFARALDLLFIQAFKSHGALYVLCVNGYPTIWIRAGEPSCEATRPRPHPLRTALAAA